MRTLEADLCAVLDQRLRQDEWEVFHEVSMYPMAAPLDLCAVRDTDGLTTLAIQAKQRANLDVYGQLLPWAERSTYAAVAVSALNDHQRIVAYRLWQTDGIGVYLVDHFGVQTLWEPVKRAVDRQSKRELAIHARRSSAGPLNPGGSRSPRVMRKPELEAEKIASALKQTYIAGQSMGAIRPELTEKERHEVAKVLNGKHGRILGLRARSFGDSDYLIYQR